MNELYPIIRRARRPLIANDAPLFAASKSATAEPGAPVADIEPAETDKESKASDAKVTHNRSSR